MFIFIWMIFRKKGRYEEKLLEVKLGQDYIAYKKKTGKWIPNFSKSS